MAYTAPRTFVTGEVETASIFNTHLRDNDLWVLTDSPACRAYKSSAFSHNSSGAWLGVTLDTERYDNSGFHSTSTNTERFTVPAGAAGKYVFGGSLIFAGSGGGTIHLIGAGLNGITNFAAVHSATPSTPATYLSINTNYSMSPATPDYFVLAALQDSGGTLSLTAGANYAPEAYAFWFRT